MIEGLSSNKLIIIFIITLILMAGMGFIIAKFGHSIFRNERMVSNLKRFVIIAIIAIVVFLVGYITILKLAFAGWSNEPVAKGEDIIKTNLGDEFLLQYETTNFPDYQTDVTVIDISNKNKLGYLHIENDYSKPQITVQNDSLNVRCYQLLESLLLYKVNSGQFKGVTISAIEDGTIQGDADLITVAKALVAKKEWKWIKVCGSFLLKSGDDEMKRTLERYASGQFSQEELDLNITGEFKKEDMQVFAKQVLEQK